MKPPKAPGSASVTIPFQVFTEIAIIAHLADNAFAKVLPDGITTAQFGVLNHLTRLGGSQTVTEIATAMQVAQPTMSSTVKKLVEHGFVQLTLSQDDARLRKVTLTRAGRAMRKRCIAATAPLHAIMTNDVAPQDWQQLLPQLRRLRCLLDENR